jgi:hypothetical protein
VQTHPATADPAGTEGDVIGVIAGFTITVPSTNGAKPGRNLNEKNFLLLKSFFFVEVFTFMFKKAK